MDPVTIAIVTAIGAGAASGLANVSMVESLKALKGLLARKFGASSKIVRALTSVEERPNSPDRQAILAEQVKMAGADKDGEVLQAVKQLLEAIQNPATASAVGVDLEKIKGAALKIEDIIATGTGVRVKDGELSGDIEIKGVRAGGQSASIPKP